MRVRMIGAVGACVAALVVAGCNRGGDETSETAGGETAAEETASGEAPDPDGRLPAEGAVIGGKPGTGDAGGAGGAATMGGGGGIDPQFAQLISRYLDSYHQQMAAGVPQAPGVGDEIAALRPGGEHRWSVRLDGGRQYGVVGACDNECDDVDLLLEDPSGQVVASDLLTDDYPLVQVTPPGSGVYTVRIRLVTCTVEPCYVGARLIRQ